VHLQLTSINYAPNFSALGGARAPSEPPGYAHELSSLFCWCAISRQIVQLFVIVWCGGLFRYNVSATTSDLDTTRVGQASSRIIGNRWILTRSIRRTTSLRLQTSERSQSPRIHALALALTTRWMDFDKPCRSAIKIYRLVRLTGRRRAWNGNGVFCLRGLASCCGGLLSGFPHACTTRGVATCLEGG